MSVLLLPTFKFGNLGTKVHRSAMDELTDKVCACQQPLIRFLIIPTSSFPIDVDIALKLVVGAVL